MKKIYKEAFLATLMVFAIMWIFFLTISISFKPFNYVAKTLKNIQLTDIYFSNLSNDKAVEDIVLVNIENLDREGIAMLTEKINNTRPKVIGLDIFFENRVDTIGDPLLEKAFRNASDKLVLAGRYDMNTQSYNENYRYYKNIAYGHADLVTNNERTKPVRTFHPRHKSKSGYLYSFAAKIAEKAAPEKFKELEERNKKKELINYTGDRNTFVSLNYRDVLASPPEELNFLKDKIVLLGYLGGMNRKSGDEDDKFFTPVNTNYVGRSLPDMYGLTIHANIISMILKENYIKRIPLWFLLIISFVLVYLHVLPFAYFFIKHHLWYHVNAKIFQLISVSVILLLVFILFKGTNILFPTKYLLLGVVLSVDVLYFYEALAILAHKKLGWNSIFVH